MKYSKFSKSYLQQSVAAILAVGLVMCFSSLSLARGDHGGTIGISREGSLGGQIYMVAGAEYHAAQLLKSWVNFVNEVQLGSPVSLQEYQHQITVRQAIQEIGVTDSLLQSQDQKFQQLLVRNDIRIQNVNSSELLWLGKGVPRTISRQFLQDLRDRGVKI